MADGTNSVQQAEAILHAQDYLQVLKTRWKEALFVFLLVFVVCAVATKLMTPEYTSSSRIAILQPNEQVDVSMSGSGVNPVALAASGQGYIPTQMEILVSQRNLTHVAGALHLDREWGVSLMGASNELRNRIKLKPVEGTNLVDIVVTHPNAQTACSICKQVVASYEALREKDEYERIQKAISDRQSAVTAAREILNTNIAKIEEIIQNSKYVAGWQPGSSVESLSGETQKYRTLQQQILTLQSEIAQLQVHNDRLKDLHDEALRAYVVNSDILTSESPASARVRQFDKDLQDKEDKKAQMLLAGYGPKHPNVLSQDEDIAKTREHLNESLNGMRDAMRNLFTTKEDELAKKKAELGTVKRNVIDETLEKQKIVEAYEEYKRSNDIYTDLERKHKGEELRLNSRRISVVPYAFPTKAGAPSTPNVKLNLIVGAVVGLISGIVVAFVYNYFDTSVKSLEDAERYLGLPVLGVIPQDAGLLALQGGNTPDAEAYRILRTNVELKRSLCSAKTFAVVSANAGEGKTTTLSNLAYVYASAGFSTLMVDADLRRPRLARYAEMEDSFGLSNYLTSDVPLKEAVFKTSVPNLYLMPSGPQPMDPSGVLGSYRMEQLLSETARRFDIVFFDSPPVLGVSDASLLVSKVDATLIVLQPRKMPLKALLRTKSIIENVRGKIMGIVMNNVDISSDTQYQYYTTYYSYYSNDNSRVEPVPAKKSSEHAMASARMDNHQASASSKSPFDDSDLY